MSLPDEYRDALHYFKTSIDFLRSYAWIYQHSNTAFIKNNVLEKFQLEFKEFFLTASNERLNKFPLLQIDEDQETIETIEYKEIENFRTKLRSLIPAKAFAAAPLLQQSIPLNGKHKNFRKMNLKKQHEITQLAQLISHLCGKENDLLIDFGCGLGYLSEMLCHLNDNRFLIIGLESNVERVAAAEKRFHQYFPESCSNRVIYKQQFIEESSMPLIKAIAEEHCQSHGIRSPKLAIVGLHACADLTITAMKIFLAMGSKLTKLMIMPCCYHKMEMNSANKFHNFPLSQVMMNALESVDDINFSNYLNRPFLRLACQQTLARWQNTTPEDHKSHGMEMFRRATAEAIIDENIEYVEKKRGTRPVETLRLSDDSFSALSQLYELKSRITNERVEWQSHHEQRFNDLRTKYPEGYKLAEGLTCLQTSMQKLCENIVLFDRFCYMQEQASIRKLSVNVRYEKILDEKLSPRCYVLIAEKL